MIFKTYPNLTQIWGIKVSGEYAMKSFVVDQNEQYLYMLEITSTRILNLVLIHWDNGTIFQFLQTNGASSRDSWNYIILSNSSSKLSSNYLNIFNSNALKSDLEPHEDSYLTALTPDNSDEGSLWKFNVTALSIQCFRYDGCGANREISYINNTSNVSIFSKNLTYLYFKWLLLFDLQMINLANIVSSKIILLFLILF